MNFFSLFFTYSLIETLTDLLLYPFLLQTGLGKGSLKFLPHGVNIKSDVNVLGQLVSESLWSRDKETALKITSGLDEGSATKDSQLLLNAWDDANFLSIGELNIHIQMLVKGHSSEM